MDLVATDLDGTIVHPDGTVSSRTVAALRACERAGVGVVIVTGRPPRWLARAATATGIRGHAVCANGAVVFDLAAGDVHEFWTISPEAVLTTVERLRAVLPDVSVALETTTGFLREPGYVSTWADATEPPRAKLEDLLRREGAEHVIKILVRAGHRGDRLWQAALEHVSDLVEPTHSNANDNLLELGPRGVSKAVTLARLAELQGVSAEGVIAFGDQPNDIPMLRWAGVGVAMADGHPEAIAAADEIAPPLSQDGVAQVLEARLAGLPSRN